MKSHHSVGIVIINFNGLRDTIECLESIVEISYPQYAVIVVDNASTIDELSKIKEVFPQFEYIQSTSNCGFSGANNIGIRHAMSIGMDCIMLLNNDTTVSKHFLEPLVSALLEGETIGLVTPQICHYQQKDTVWLSGGKLNKYTGTGYGMQTGKKIILSDRTEKISFASGCCVLMSKEAILTVGEWDENFFLYMEDVDYSFRMVKAGFGMLVVKNSVIFHKINASTGRNNNQLPIYYTIRNRLYFSRKHFDFPSVFSFAFIFITTMVKLTFWLFADKSRYRFGKLALKDFVKGKTGMMI